MWRRFLRMARMGLVILSLIACAALAALWVESYRHSYSILRHHVRESEGQWWPSSWGAVVNPSNLSLWRVPERSEAKTVILSGPEGQMFEIPTPRPLDGWKVDSDLADAAWLPWRLTAAGQPRRRLLVLPLWPLVLVAGVGPVWWTAGRIARRQARRRAAAGLCPACGYDLRASSDACPECGLGRGVEPPARGVRGGEWSRRWWAIVVVTCVVAAMAGVIVAGIVRWGPTATASSGVPLP